MKYCRLLFLSDGRPVVPTSPPTKPSFYAVLSKNVTEADEDSTSLHPYEIIHEDSPKGFNITTGAYTVPVDGTYVLSATLVVNSDHHVEATIASIASINGVPTRPNLLGTFVANSGGHFYGSGSKTLVCHLNKGEKVFVYIAQPSGVTYTLSKNQSSFSGFLLN